MSCSIKDRIDSGIYTAINKFVGGSTSFTVNENVVTMPVSDKFTKNQLYLIAQKNSERVYKWAKEEYGPAFQHGWINIDTSMWNNVIVRFRIPPALFKAWEVQDNVISLEEANEELLLPDLGNDFYMGDTALAEQNQRENESEQSFYNDVIETQSERNDLFNSKVNWKYDKLKEIKDPMLFDDDIMDNLMNDLNKC